MMACAIDEALRNYVAVGGDIGHVAGLDNFCWCDPVESEKTPDGAYKAAQLVRANKALYDYCLAFGVPLISGKDSMKNDYQIGDDQDLHPADRPLLGHRQDRRCAPRRDHGRQAPGDLVYLLGSTGDELGGSEYYTLHGVLGRNVPQVDAASALRRVPRRQPRPGARVCSPPVTICPMAASALPWRKKPLPADSGFDADLRQVINDRAPAMPTAFSFPNRRAACWSRCKPENRARFEALFRRAGLLL